MKILKNICLGILAIVFTISCNDGIDSITQVDPGADETAPVIKVTYPLEGTKIQVLDIVTSINIKFEVIDDIEIGNIVVTVDDTEIMTYSNFKDYRRSVNELPFNNVTNGDHVLKIVATDLEGKTTTKTINFMKVSPYTVKYDGEIFYMPFDGDYLDLVSLKGATVVGSPSFAGQSLKGLNAYAGATDSYLTFPTDQFKNNELSAVFWVKINAIPDRAGILVMGPEDTANPTAQNNRKNGFRFFRENAGGKQRFKLNVGNGTADTWIDGGIAADVDPTIDKWVSMAFTISGSSATVYIDGQLVKQSTITGIDWTGCDVLSIMSGAPRFSGWNHKSDLSFMDELRIFNKALSQTEIQNIITGETGATFSYTPKYDGETFYMPFDDINTELVSGIEPTVVGAPSFSTDNVLGGSSFVGNTDSAITFPINGVFGSEFSGAFWYKVNASPDRAGILVVGNNIPENRKQGFRLFREGSATEQRIKLNVGIGADESWNDGGVINVADGEWVHIAFTVSLTKSIIYFNGVEKLAATYTGGVNWTDCQTLTIGAGGETFSYWNHKSDSSKMDELRLFNKVLTTQEIQTIMNE